MKRNILYALLLLVIMSCKTESEELLIISLEGDKIEAVADGVDKVSFSVTTSLGEDVTKKASISIDGIAIDGSTYSTKEVGEYSFVAKYLGTASDPVKVKFIEPLSVNISADKLVAYADGKDVIVLTSTNHLAEDVTNETIFYINDKAIEGNTVVSETEDTFEVYAKYQHKQSSAITIEFVVPESIILSVDKNVAIADGKDLISFTTTNHKGDDVTDESVFYVNDKAISGHNITSDKSGSFSIYAVYGNVSSQTIEVVFEEPLSITLSSNKTIAKADGEDVIIFKVTNNKDEDITSESIILVDNEEIESNFFVSNKFGKYNVSAKYQEVESNTIEIEFEEVVNSNILQIGVDKKKLVSDGIDMVVFRSTNMKTGKDVTSESVFYVNGVQSVSNFFKSTSSGNYVISAKYNDMESGEIVIKANSTFDAPQRVFAELFAATWCPYCPDGLLFLDNVTDTPEIISMTMHVSTASFDPFAANEKGVSMYKSFGISSIPTILVDRNIEQKLSPKYNNPSSTLTKFITKNNGVGISIESVVNGSTANVNALVSSTSPLGKVRVSAMIVESGLVYDQRNGVRPDLGNPIKGYVHNNVYRYAIGDIYGEITSAVSNTIEKSFSIDLDADWNKDKLEIIILVCSLDNIVLNVQKVKLGSSIGY